MAIFIGVVATPITLYLYLVHPAWSWMYAIDPGRVPHLAIVPILAAHAGMVVVGWYAGARLLRLKRDRAALYTLAGAALVTLVVVLLAHHRLSSYGSYDEFHQGLALDLWDVKLGYVLVALALGLAAAAGYVALELARDSRRVRTR